MVKKALKKALVLTMAIVTTLVTSAGCSSQSSKSSASGGSGTASQSPKELTYSVLSEFAGLDPVKQLGTSQRTVKLCIYRGLFNYDENGKLSNELCKSYDLSTDMLTYTFHLRDAKFQNGDPVTAEDVKYTISRIQDPATGATFKSNFDIIDSMTVVDSKTLQIKLKSPCAPFVSYLALPESGILSESYTKSHNIAKEPMGAGPFKFVKWVAGQDIELTKFSGYYKSGYPKLDNIKFNFYADESARENALISGDVDIIENLPTKAIATVKSNSNLKYIGGSGPFQYLKFNTKVKALSSSKVRQAISYAIDRDKLIKTCNDGFGTAIYGMPFTKDLLGYDPETENYFSYNVDKAKSLLAEAGFPNGFSVKLTCVNSQSLQVSEATSIADDLKKAGITVQIVSVDVPTRTTALTSGNYQMAIDGTAGDITDPDWLRNYFYTGEAGLNNSAYFSDKKIDELLDAGIKTTDSTKREAIYKQFDKLALEDSPFVFLHYRQQSFGTQNYVVGFKNLPGGLSYQSGLMLEKTDINK